MPIPELIPRIRENSRASGETAPAHPPRERMSLGDLDLRILEQYAAPSIVVNEAYDIVHLSERAGRFLHQPGGEPSLNVLNAVRPELRPDLRTALYQAAQQRSDVESRGLAIRLDDRDATISLSVRPVLREDDPARGFFLILFDEGPQGPGQATPPSVVTADDTTRSLEQELLRMKSQLRATIERSDTQSEELRASNEELQATNEELRSSTEELETSREELQSVNEELRTVNQELKVKVDEQSQANDDILNLINSTEIGTVFLDRASRVKLFTPSARDIFNLIPADRGRALSDISNQLIEPDLNPDIERVLVRLERVSREVRTRDGRHFLMQVVPYRTVDDRIDGVTMTFLDITVQKQAEDNLRVAKEELERRVTDRTRELENLNRLLDQELKARITIQEDERRRIARDLHDHIGQQTTAIRLALDAARAVIRSPEEAGERLDDLDRLLATLDRELAFLAWELRPAALDELGLATALGNFVHEWSRNCGVPAAFHTAALDHRRLGFELETNLYRIAQEALNNVQKHAEATRVEVILELRGREVVLIVEDNGRGFVSEPAADGRLQPFGFSSMHERAALLGGQLEVESTVGTGTTIFVRIPFPPRSAAVKD
jgi:signal transduction histidine kinase